MIKVFVLNSNKYIRSIKENIEDIELNLILDEELKRIK